MTTRDELTDDIRDLVAQLIDGFDETTIIDYRPSRDAHPTGPLPKPRRERRTIHVPGLLTQLANLIGEPNAASTDAPSSGSAPTTNPPPGADAAVILADAHHAIHATLLDALASASCQRTTGVLDPRGQARALVGITLLRATTGELALDDRGTRTIRANLRTLTTSIRTHLGWDVPTITIPDTTCPECLTRGHLTVAADATTDVRCTARLAGPALPGQHWPLHCGATWPRHTWLALLTQMTA